MAGRRSGKRKRVRASAEDAQRLILDAAEKRLRERRARRSGSPGQSRATGPVGHLAPRDPAHFSSRDGLTQALEHPRDAPARGRAREVLSTQPARGETAVDVIEALVFATSSDAGTALCSRGAC